MLRRFEKVLVTCMPTYTRAPRPLTHSLGKCTSQGIGVKVRPAMANKIVTPRRTPPALAPWFDPLALTLPGPIIPAPFAEEVLGFGAIEVVDDGIEVVENAVEVVEDAIGVVEDAIEVV